ncbi:phytoene desaturase family protein [Flavisolibacter ginsenosidimutans]|uniref:Phytoene desaturase n=1 Tax=Flavisolibacter ginsenosidimutans TaxID=661481 RepID=A0A5B8UIU2_9BACT|nr:phytoene desaturase family protein [Flavisolibacter ginsenosidimutans]QEC56463.1 phytoene desaturase [Flavisolibacter ginsenosidimutans]
MSKSVVIIGAGFAGLSSAAFMAKAGWKVTVVEKNSSAGGRAQQLKAAGFTYDMGPSWYWMPDVFERFFAQFGKSVADYYSLLRLSPSYRVYWNDGHTDIPADYGEFKNVFESFEKGAGEKLDKYLKEASLKYKIGMQDLVYKPGQSLTEFLDWNVIKNVFRLDVFTSIQSHVAKHFQHPRLRQLMEFPILFLGALPQNTPALYSLMNYADIVGGTWYPEAGMFSIVKAMQELAEELGVEFRFNEAAQEIIIENGKAKRLITDKAIYEADAVISGADYQFTESHLLPQQWRTYNDDYWNKKVLAPSCLLYYVGLNKKLQNVLHHSLFFDVPFDQHAGEIYAKPQWPKEPLFYLSVSSKTDDSVAPEGCENLVLLIPVASGLKDDTEELREQYFQRIIQRLEKHTGQSIADAVVFKKAFSVSDFVSEYNSYKGNAYGLANTLRQTAIFRPSCRSKKVKNLFYTGQFTVPGPGVPPSLISGEVVSKELLKLFN